MNEGKNDEDKSNRRKNFCMFICFDVSDYLYASRS